MIKISPEKMTIEEKILGMEALWQDLCQNNHIKSYIKNISKKSVYLLNVLNLLSNRYKYDFALPSELISMSNLLKMCHAKHRLKDDKLIHEMKQISNEVIPKRSLD